MKAVTITEAKEHLSELIDAAHGGQQILITRGAKPAATLLPVGEEDISIFPPLRVSDRAAAALQREARADLKSGKVKAFESVATLRKHLSGKRAR